MRCANLYLVANKFGDAVRLARLEKGWSQREVARRINKSATYIHYLERDLNPSAKSETLKVGEEAHAGKVCDRMLVLPKRGSA